MGAYQGKIEGKLIAESVGEGSLSEGPQYWIIPNDDYKKWDKILVRKKVMMWQKEPELEQFLNQVVEIEGEIIETRTSITLDFASISKME